MMNPLATTAKINPFNAVNRGVYIADNLQFLRSINSNSVDLVCIDPPFAKNDTFTANKLKPPLKTADTNNEFRLLKYWSITSQEEADAAEIAWPDDPKAKGGYNDTWSWDEDVHPDWLIGIEHTHPAVSKLIDASRHIHGDSIAAYLAFMAIRLFEIHRILKPTGSLFLHCDHSANGYLRQLLDAIFGKDNFRNEIAWCYTGPANVKRWFPRKHDTIFFYAKSENSKFYKDSVRIPYKELSSGGGGGIIFSAGHDEDRMDQLREIGKVPESYWTDINPLTRKNKERTGYPTQKPVALAQRIIQATTDPGDVVLDCFAGCAYTALAAEKLGRNWAACDLNIRAWTVFKRQFEKGGTLPVLDCNDIMTGQQTLTEEIVTVHGPTELPTRTDDRSGVEVKLLRTDNRRKSIPKGKNSHAKPLLDREEMMTALLQFSHGLAWCCGYTSFKSDGITPVLGDYQLDHITPQSVGGIDDITNRAPLCPSHNRLKSDLDIDLSELRGEVAFRQEIKPGLTMQALPRLDRALAYAQKIRGQAYQKKYGNALL